MAEQRQPQRKRFEAGDVGSRPTLLSKHDYGSSILPRPRGRIADIITSCSICCPAGETWSGGSNSNMSGGSTPLPPKGASGAGTSHYHNGLRRDW